MNKLFAKRQFNFDFIAQRKPAYALSIVLLLASFICLWVRGLNYGIDFEGGILIEASSAAPIDMEWARSELSFLENLSLQSAGAEGKTLLIQSKLAEGENGSQIVSQIKEALGAGYAYEKVDVIGPTISAELKYKSFLATVCALLAIAIYIWFRFEWPFAVGCLLSLAHDLIIVVGIFSLFQIEFDMIVVAGLLSLAGYDCNDTIVTYDRVRENLRKFRKLSIDEILNRSTNEVLSRTLLTALTTMFVVCILLFMGGPTLHGFSVAMILGTVFGTYSSIYTAVPLLRYFDIRSIGQSADEGARIGQR